MRDYIEITNLNFNNKGDHLMVEAVLLELSQRLNWLRFCVPLGATDFCIRDRHNFLQTLRMAHHLRKKDFLANRYYGKYLIFQSFFPDHFLIHRGFVPERKVKAIFDISGYSHTDLAKSKKPEQLVEAYQKGKKRNELVILMPKTFGPLNDPILAKSTREIVSIADLVFCRDQLSYEWLEKIGAIGSNVHLATDYTGSVPGILPTYADRYKDRATIIPNYRMIDKTDLHIASSYVDFLVTAFKFLENKGKKPFILLHDKITDMPVLNSMQTSIGEKIDVLIEDDPIFNKGIIGKCSSVVSSRLHGIINGLSQGVPTIGSGWAHKYPMIFKDYECSEMLITDIRDKDEVKKKLELLCNEQHRFDIKERLHIANKKIHSLNNDMWNLIEQKLTND